MGLNMKLYSCNRKVYVTIVGDPTKEVFFFDHLDGMYSYCKNKKGEVVHLAAFTVVKVVDKPEGWDAE